MPTIETTAPASETSVSESSNGHAKKVKVTKKAAKKAKKAAKGKSKTNGKAKKPAGERKPRGLSKLQGEVLKVLHRNPDGLTRPELTAKVDTFIGTSCLGQEENDKVKETSLLGRGYVSFNKGEPKKLADGSYSENEGPKIIKITAAGKKALEALKG